MPMPSLIDRPDKWEKYTDTLSLQELERYEKTTIWLQKLFRDKWNQKNMERIFQKKAA